MFLRFLRPDLLMKAAFPDQKGQLVTLWDAKRPSNPCAAVSCSMSTVLPPFSEPGSSSYGSPKTSFRSSLKFTLSSRLFSVSRGMFDFVRTQEYCSPIVSEAQLVELRVSGNLLKQQPLSAFDFPPLLTNSRLQGPKKSFRTFLLKAQLAELWVSQCPF
jgi:hypothetical protein